MKLSMSMTQIMEPTVSTCDLCGKALNKDDDDEGEGCECERVRQEERQNKADWLEFAGIQPHVRFSD